LSKFLNYVGTLCVVGRLSQHRPESIDISTLGSFDQGFGLRLRDLYELDRRLGRQTNHGHSQRNPPSSHLGKFDELAAIGLAALSRNFVFEVLAHELERS
jgi:hypothetical protein